MTLRQLELFIAVAESGSFSRGGDILTLTQSTVSQHIAALEEEFGTRLLDRTGKGVRLTAGGEVLLQQARRVLVETELLRQAMDRFHGLEDVQLLLGASNIPANYLLPDLLPLLHQQHPGISLQVQMGDSRQVIDAVLQRRLELGLVGARVTDDGLRFIPVMTDRLILIVGPDHPLRWSGTISIEQLLEQGLVVREEGSGTYQTLREAFVAQGCDPAAVRILARLGSNEAVRRTVAAGFGCAFVSDLSVRESLQRGELYQVAVAGLDIERQLWLVHLRDRTCSPAAEAVMSLLLEHLSH